MSNTKNLKSLGSKKTVYKMDKVDASLLETFQNLHPGNDYVIPIEYIRFTSLCPKTHQPDGADIYIKYIPNQKCVESKSLKLYMFSFRNTGSFMEDITNTIMNDLVKILNPKYLEIYSKFISRGDIFLRPFACYYQKDADKEKINNLLYLYGLQK